MIKLYPIIFIFLVLISCKSQIDTNDSENSKQKSTNTNYTSCQLIEKEFIGKGGKTGILELYLRCSIQDYYIKICEGAISKEQLTPYINMGITVDMEIKEGSWDICDNDQAAQSRIGTYVIINQIIE